MTNCLIGYKKQSGKCVDEDECAEELICGENANCFNTVGSYYCNCHTGFKPEGLKPAFNFTQENGVECRNINKCVEENIDCGSNAKCVNSGEYYSCTCKSGFISSSGNKTLSAGLGVQDPQCVEIVNDECVNASINCGPNAECVNNQGGYICICRTGYAPNNGKETFIAGQGVQCDERNECDHINCGKNAMCHNSPGHFYCTCAAGFTLNSGETNFTDTNENCESVCDIDKSICGGGTCKNSKDGHECVCSSGFTNNGHKQMKCTEFNYETFKKEITAFEANPELAELVFLMNSSYEALKQNKFQDGEKLLEEFLSALDELLYNKDQLDNKKASAVFNIVESMLKLIGLTLSRSQTKRSTTRTDVELLIKRDSSPPVGHFMVSTNGTTFTSHWDTATGNEYMGFTTVALLSYTGLKEPLSRYFNRLETQEKQTFKINSEIVTATVSNRNTSELKEPVNFTFSHLKV